MSSAKYNPPPNWPSPPEGWTPPEGWQPDPAWEPAPEGWVLWLDEPGVIAVTRNPSTDIVGRLHGVVDRMSSDEGFFTPDDIWRADGRSLSGIGKGRYRLTALYLFCEKGLLSLLLVFRYPSLTCTTST